MSKIKSSLLISLFFISWSALAESPKFFVSLTESLTQRYVSNEFQGKNLSKDKMTLYGFSNPDIKFFDGYAQLKSNFWYKRFLDPKQELILLDISGNFEVTFALVFQNEKLVFQNLELKRFVIDKQPELEKTLMPVFIEFFRQFVIWEDQERLKKEYGWSLDEFDVVFQKQILQIRINGENWKPKNSQITQFSMNEQSLNLIVQKWNTDVKVDIAPAPKLQKEGLVLQIQKSHQVISLVPILEKQNEQLILGFQNVKLDQKMTNQFDSLKIPLTIPTKSQPPKVSQVYWENDRLTIYFE